MESMQEFERLKSLNPDVSKRLIRRVVEILDYFPSDTDIPHSSAIRIPDRGDSVILYMEDVRYLSSGGMISGSYGIEWAKVFLIKFLLHGGLYDLECGLDNLESEWVAPGLRRDFLMMALKDEL